MFEALRNFFAIFLLLTLWVVQLSLPTPCAQNPTLGAKQDEGPNTAGLLVNIFTLAWTKISKPRGVGQVQISIVSDNSYKSFFFFFWKQLQFACKPTTRTIFASRASSTSVVLFLLQDLLQMPLVIYDFLTHIDKAMLQHITQLDMLGMLVVIQREWRMFLHTYKMYFKLIMTNLL